MKACPSETDEIWGILWEPAGAGVMVSQSCGEDAIGERETFAYS